MLYLIVSRRSDDGSIGNDQDGAIYRSDDEAESWEKIPLPAGTNGPTSLVTDPGRPEPPSAVSLGTTNKRTVFSRYRRRHLRIKRQWRNMESGIGSRPAYP